MVSSTWSTLCCCRADPIVRSHTVSADWGNPVEERDYRDLLHQCRVPAERHPELAAESPKETLAPRHNAIAAQYRHHGPPTLASLLKWHPQRSLQCFDDGVGVIRVSEHGSVEFVGRAREGRENEHAGVIGVLCSDILLGNQVHSVTQRSDESHAAEPKEASERALGKAPVQVLDRRPIEFRVATGHVARQRTEPLPQRTIFRNVAARCGGDLQEADVVAVCGIAVEKAGERLEPVLESLTVIEPVHPNDEPAPTEALLQPACRPGFHSATGHFGDGFGIDTNREGAGAKNAIESVNVAIGRNLASCAANDGVMEGGQILRCLEADEIISAQ